MRKKFIEKNLWTIVLLVCIVFAYIYKSHLNKQQEAVTVLVEEAEQIERESEIVKLKIYDSFENKIKEKEIEVNNKQFLTMGDYIKLILENSEFLTNKMDLLSVYELDDEQVLVILSDEFRNLSKSSFVAVTTTIKLNLKEAFPNVKVVNIKLDSD
ncbi:hypothetical protein [Oceanivirga salmonicida]|nr:hypothetical protein [Oceanivirga salmonicida]